MVLDLTIAMLSNKNLSVLIAPESVEINEYVYYRVTLHPKNQGNMTVSEEEGSNEERRVRRRGEEGGEEGEKRERRKGRGWGGRKEGERGGKRGKRDGRYEERKGRGEEEND